VERACDIGTARVPDSIEPGATFLVRQSLQFLDRSGLIEVVAEDGDV